MLTHISIKNLALVDHLCWHLGKGLIGVTGETGAGKSVIVGALKLILGERAVKDMIRTGEASCSVEAIFSLNRVHHINQLLDQAGIAPCEDDQLIIRRVIGQSSNKQFVNNSPATLAFLKKLGEHLVDLHGPHDHQSLLSTERQLSMLDAYAGAYKEADAYHAIYSNWKDKLSEINNLQKSEQANEQEIDLLRYQIDEITQAQIRPEEEGKISERYKRVSNSAKLREGSGFIVSVLSNELNQKLSEVQRVAKNLENLDSDVIGLLAGLDSAIVELQELERSMADYNAHLDTDPGEVAVLEERINTFETLKRKYGPTLADVDMHHKNAINRLKVIENRDENIENLLREECELKAKLLQTGEVLSMKRSKAAPELANEISKHLKELGFVQASFEVSILNNQNPGANGLESVEFQFGPNPGEPMKPLRSIASSGEISRVMLAVKSALANQDATPLMVFDEIDANVGGEIARIVGEKMAFLGKKHQVISITHFPQVAAVATEHFVVDKVIENGRTRSTMHQVKDNLRIDELVRMLGGGNGKQAREMAVSLIPR